MISKTHLIAVARGSHRQTACGIVGFVESIPSEMCNITGDVRYFITSRESEVDCGRCRRAAQKPKLQ